MNSLRFILQTLLLLTLFSCVGKGSLTFTQSSPTVEVSGNLSASEGNDFVLDITLNKARTENATFYIQLRSSRNDVSADFVTPVTEVVFPAGVISKQITLSLGTDIMFEGEEDFELTIMNDATTAISNTYTLSAIDTSTPPELGFSTTTQTIDEQHGTVTVQVNLDSASEAITTVPYTLSGTGVYLLDHNLVSGTLTIPAGSVSGTITFQILNDTLPESSKSIALTLGTPVNATLDTLAATHSVTLVDDDLGVTINQASAQIDPINLLPIDFEVVFSQAINPATFTTADITQSGTASGITWGLTTADNITYQLRASVVTGAGTLVPQISAGIIQTSSGYQNLVSTNTDNSVVYDITSPTVTISRVVGQQQITSSLPVDFKVLFSEPVANFTITDVTNLGTATATWQIIDSGNATEFTLRTSSSTSGSLYPWIPATSVTDLSGNPNLVTTGSDYVVYGLAVIPLYPTMGRNWNDYVKDDGASFKLATETACVGNETNYRNCRHAGEMRMLVLPGVTSCAGLTVVDDLGWFDWGDCDITRGVATFYTKKLKGTKGLRDLLLADGSAWVSNKVTISGAFTGSTTLDKWWTNPLEILADNSAPGSGVTLLDDVSKIYVLTASAASQGLNVTADKVGFVTLGTSVLTYGGDAANNCSTTTGLSTAVDNRCVISNGSNKHLWIEARLNGDGGANDTGVTLNLVNTAFSHIHNTKVYNSSSNRMIGVRGNRLKNLTLSGLGDLILNTSTGNFFQETNFTRKAVSMTGSTGNVFDRGIVNGFWSGLFFSAGSHDNVISQYTVVNGGSGDIGGIHIQSERNIIAFSTVANSVDTGIATNPGGYNTILNALSVNNTEEGFTMAGVNNSFINVVAAHNGNVGFLGFWGVNLLSGNLLSGNNSAHCNIFGGFSGLDASCIGNSVSTGRTNSILNVSVNLTTSYVGDVLADTQNSSDTGATVVAPNFDLLDQLNFENIYRTWAKYGNASNVHSTNRGIWFSGNGRIWDYSLSSADTIVRNRSGDGANANGAFVNAAACPAEIHGNRADTDISGGEVLGDGIGNNDGTCEAGEVCQGHTFLTNAMEVFDDDIGNENGLCESNEACIYAPNFGSYQGHGDYTTLSCTFQNGTVTGVTMYAYPTNGR